MHTMFQRPKVYFNFIDVLLLYFGSQHVSATHMVIFKEIYLRTRILLQLNMSESIQSFKNYIISGQNSLFNDKFNMDDCKNIGS